MKLDSSLAWKQANAAISANREVLLALAGVFFLLPRLAFQLLAPTPPTATAGASDAWLVAMQAYYLQVAPYLVPMRVIEAIGTLAMLALFTDRTRPTVGEAIMQGLQCVLPYLAAQLLFALTISVGGGVAIGLAAASGNKPLATLAFILAVLGAIYSFLRVILVAPVIAVERIRQPVAALKRAWGLSHGNVGRMLLFLALLMIVLLVVVSAVVGISGSAVALLAGAQPARITVAILASALSAGFAVYLAAALAAIHRQLAGASVEAISANFE